MIKKIKADMMEAMREKDTIKKDSLKMVVNRANMLAKEAKIEAPTDEMVLTAIKKEIKQLQDTRDILEKNGRKDSDLYIESATKQQILKTYLPKQLDENTLRNEIKKMIDENNIDTSNKGAVMKLIMPAFKSKADGKLINQIVSELL